MFLDYATRPLAESAPTVRLVRGIPVVDYPFGSFHNAVTTAEYGLEHYSRYVRSHRRRDRDRAVRAANWLVSTQRHGRWEYSFPFLVPATGETLQPPWISAMAQGYAMSLLTRVYALTHRDDYLRAAKRALAPFRTSVAQGGVVRRFRGQPFYEEYPTPGHPTYVLNGFMFSLIGLYDLAPRSAEARRRYDAGRRALQLALPLYDDHTNSLYHLAYLFHGPTSRLPVTGSYNGIHVLELNALNSQRPNSVFRRWRDRFASYEPAG